jgi:class 3 adenylate cyclase
MAERNADVPPTSRIEFRMGVNVGDVVVEDRRERETTGRKEKQPAGGTPGSSIRAIGMG